jgi:hypothetical protein
LTTSCDTGSELDRKPRRRSQRAKGLSPANRRNGLLSRHDPTLRVFGVLVVQRGTRARAIIRSWPARAPGRGCVPPALQPCPSAEPFFDGRHRVSRLNSQHYSSLMARLRILDVGRWWGSPRRVCLIRSGAVAVSMPRVAARARRVVGSRSRRETHVRLAVNDEDRHRPESESARGSGSKRLPQQARCAIGRSDDDSVRPLHEERIRL